MARPIDEALRGRLIRAASIEFADKGFAAASVASIGEAVDVTKGGVYFHFRGKEELFFAAVDHWRQELRRLLVPPASEAEDAEDDSGETVTLHGFLAEYLRFHFRHAEASGLMRILASEMRQRFTTRLREDHQATQRALRSRVRDLLMVGIHDGTMFTTDPALLTFVLVASVEGVISLTSSSPRDSEPFRHPESIVDFLLAPYETGGEARQAGSESAPRPGGVDFLPPI